MKLNSTLVTALTVLGFAMMMAPTSVNASPAHILIDRRGNEWTAGDYMDHWKREDCEFSSQTWASSLRQ